MDGEESGCVPSSGFAQGGSHQSAGSEISQRCWPGESFPKKVWFPQKQAVDFLVLPPVKSLNRRKQLPPPQPCWFL